MKASSPSHDVSSFRSFSPVNLVISIVSHGHGALVQGVLWDLARLSSASVSRVVLTLNLPEAEPLPPAGGWPFVLQIANSTRPAGFGTNHNRALAGAAEPFVCVLNPDVELTGGDPFAALVQAAATQGVGCSYPVQFDAQGCLQDSERELPTPWTLWHRRARGRRETRVDWVNAACLVLPQPVWRALGGFDESYHMYCEDVDLCLRIQLAGYRLQKADCTVVHAGSRASRKKLNHLRWHISSLLRLWASPAYRRYKKMRPSLR